MKKNCCWIVPELAGMGNQIGGTVGSNIEKAQDAAQEAANRLTTCFRDSGAEQEVQTCPAVLIGLHGPEVVLEGCRMYGEGSAIASAAIKQDRTYFEVKIERNGTWAFGVAKKKAHANKFLKEKDGDCFVINNTDVEALVGDVLGCTLDMAVSPATVKFYLNGVNLAHLTKEGVKGEVFCAMSVCEGAELEYEFDGNRGFVYPSPSGFSGVMVEKRIM